MQLLHDADFQQWMARAGIAAHPRFPLSLAFTAAPDCQDSWLPNGRITDLPGFLQTIVATASGDGAVWLYRNAAESWYDGPDSTIGNHIIDRVIGALGVPADFKGAIGFGGTEWRDFYLVLSTFFVWAWSVGEDLYVIPKNGSCLLMTSHHGEIFARFPSELVLERFRATMAAAGHPSR